MQHTLAAVFDNRTSAQQAMDELVRCGFPNQDLALKDSSTEAAAGEGRIETGDRDESFGQSVLHFFSDMFGAHHADTHVYTEAVSRGNTVLTFVTDDQDKVERAADIIEAYGPVDIDEYESQWRAGGWTGAETMRTSGYQGASMHAGQSGASAGFAGAAGMQSGTAGMTNTGASGSRSGMSTSTGSTASFGTGSQPLQGSSAPGSAIGGSSSQGSQQRDTMQGSTGSVPASSDLKMGNRTGQTGGARVYSRVQPGTSYLTGADHESAYRSHYMSHMAALGGGYEDYDPAYKYGSAMAHDPVYSGRSWDEIEPTLRGDWESKNPGSAWERFKAAVRHGWDRITSDDDKAYRSHWSSSYAAQGGSYEDYAPAYRYGSSMASTTYKGRPWDEVEPELRSSWETSHPSDAWERVKAGVRHGWDRMTDDHDSAYRSHWSTNYAASGSSYDEYEPAYRYGSSMAASDTHRGRGWDDVEGSLSSDWEKRNPRSTWESVKAAVRHGWERMKS